MLIGACIPMTCPIHVFRSEEQRVEAVRRVEALGLDDRVQILFRDYRKYVNAETEATYDAVVSIEMIEVRTVAWTTSACLISPPPARPPAMSPAGDLPGM